MGFDPAGAFEAPYGLTTVGSYALVARRHMEVYGTTSEQLAEVAVTMRRHASLNPNAKMQREITVQDVMESRIISDPLHLLDCCIISDGGGAVVVTSRERARDLAKPAIVLLGVVRRSRTRRSARPIFFRSPRINLRIEHFGWPE